MFRLKSVFRQPSMRARMTLAFTLSITALLIVADISLVFYTHWSAQKAANTLLDQSKREIRREIDEGEHDAANPHEFAREEGQEMSDRGVALFVLHNNELLHAPKKLFYSWPLPKTEWKTTSLPFGPYTVVLALPWYKSVHHLQEVAFTLIGLSIVVIAATSLGSWLLLGKTLAPIGALSTQAHSHAIGDRSILLQAPSEDSEVVQLVATLNELLVRLESDARAKARFYAAASHELRTPLQSLAGFLELGLSRERSNNEYRVTLQEVETQSRNLITLVNDLLYLNQLDTATSHPPADEVDLSDVAERSIQRLQKEADARHLQIDFLPDTTGTGIVQAPWSHIEMLVRNLVENGVKYTTPGKRLRVRCGPGLLEVWNECAPVAGWDDEKIFEPFFRPDAARTSHTGGNGLGLAICKAICTANGWGICICQVEGGVLAKVHFSDKGYLKIDKAKCSPTLT